MSMVSDMCIIELTDITSESICLLKSAYTVYVTSFRTFATVNLTKSPKT